MEFWLGWFHEHSTGSDVLEIARQAEQLGFTGVALPDHVAIPKEQASRHPLRGTGYDPHMPYIDPFTTAAAMGAVTDKLRFMTYALVMGMRDPFTVAKMAASLSDLTDGRFDLGITPGWLKEEMALLGHDPKTRGKRFDEALAVMDGLWRNDFFSYKGEHYQFNDVAIYPSPVVTPKILIGGHSKKALDRVGRHDGWIGMNHPTDELVVMLHDLKADPTASKKEHYIIPPDSLTQDSIEQMANLGVRGMVIMPWPLLDPAYATVKARLATMEAFAAQWL